MNFIFFLRIDLKKHFSYYIFSNIKNYYTKNGLGRWKRFPRPKPVLKTV